MKFSTINFYKEICDSFLEISERLDSIEYTLAEIQMVNEISKNSEKRSK